MNRIPLLRLVCVLFPIVQLAGVAGGEVEMRSIGGPFNLYAIERTWSQRILTLVNDSDTAGNVQVAYVGSDPDGSKITFFRVVGVPPGCQRRVTLSVRPGELTPAGGKIKSYPICRELYRVTDPQTGRLLDQRRLGRVGKLPEDLTTLCVIPESPREEFDTNSYLKDVPDHLIGKKERLPSAVRDLPDRWYGYSLARIVLLTGMDMQELRPSQVEALLDWTRRGGVLVVVGGEYAPGMLRGELGSTCGVTVRGVHRIASLRITDSRGNVLPRVELEHPLHMAELCVDSAGVLLSTDGLPLMTQNPCGAGWALTLSVPLGALRDAEIYEKVFDLIGKARKSVPSIDPNNFRDPGRQALRSIAGRRGPHQLAPFLILAGAGGIVLIAGALLRFVRRGELVWVALIPMTVIGAIVMYAYGSIQTSPQRLTHLGLICDVGEDMGWVQEVFAYYSGPENQNVSFSAGTGRGSISHISTGGMGTVLETRCDGTMVLPDRLVTRNSMSSFEVDAVVRTRGLDGALTLGPRGLTGALTNHLGAEIENAVILVNRQTYRLGDIAGGGETEIAVGGSDRLGKGEFTGSLIQTQADTLRNALVKELLNQPSMDRKVHRAPVLIGYTTATPLGVLGNRSLQRDGWSVVVWGIELARPPSGSTVRIPSGFVDRKFDKNAILWDSVNETFNEHTMDAELIVRARAPEGIGPLRDATAILEINLHAPDYRLTISGLREHRDGRREYTELERIERPAGLLKPITVSDINRFRSDKDGCYVFSLNVEQAGEEFVASRRWWFNSADVALEGVSQ